MFWIEGDKAALHDQQARVLVDTVNDIPEGSGCMQNPMITMTKAIGSMRDINSNNEYEDYTVHLWTGLEDDPVDAGGCGGWTHSN